MAQKTIHDTEGYNSCLEGFDEVFEKYAGEVLAVDERSTIPEGSWPYSP